MITSSFAHRGRLRHELYIDTRDADQNLAIFSQLKDRRVELETAYGRSLEFEELADRRACRIADYTAGNVSDQDSHDEFISWFIDAGVRLRRALGSVTVEVADE